MTIAATVRSMHPVWQKSDGQRHIGHSWQHVDGRSVTAMSLLALLVLLAAVVLIAVAVALAVRNDGYGNLEPPRSHPLDDVFPGWPGRLV